jgi:NADH:ubiquinone oxidoreductase subunit 6 (subunit J)
MMSKRAGAGIGVAVVLLVALGACIYATSWDGMYEPTPIPYNGEAGMNAPSNTNDDGTLKENSLNYGVFEAYGPLLLVLALLMFGAMVGGICVAREEVENDDTD